VVLGLEERMMLASDGPVAAAAVAPAPVTTLSGASFPLALKRVPGFLAGWKVDNLATPYDQPIIAGLRIDDKTVDYWEITLNKADSVLLTLTADSLPGGGKSPTDFVVRIWDPDGKEILPANQQPVSGTQFSYVTKTDGTYTIGISTSRNAGYAFDPTRHQTPPDDASTSLHVYTATFNAFPGPNTDLINILQNYTANWPEWKGDQLTAYNTLTAIATAGSNQGTGIIDFSGSFEQVLKAPIAYIPKWLDITWNPFQTILDSNNQLATATTIYKHHAYPAINLAYPQLSSWLTVVTPFVTDPGLQRAYTDVHQILLTANETRTNVDYFLQSLKSWSAAYQDNIVKGRAFKVATELTTGLTPKQTQAPPVQQFGWLKTLLGSAVNIISGIVGVAGGGPPGALATSIVLNAIANPVDAYLDGDFDSNKKPPYDPANTDTSSNMLEAANQMDSFRTDAFLNTFRLVSSPEFEASLFSNYGLLQAMEYIRFDPSPGGVPTPTDELRKDYDTTVWEQLLPRMFKWELAPFTDNGPNNTLRNFTFFVPASESASWQNRLSDPPININPDPTRGVVWIDHKWSESPQQMTAEAKTELLELQQGSPFQFQGHDFTPPGWGGPGPISVPQTLRGNLGGFYTITPNAQIQERLYRHEPYVGYWRTDATLDGDTIQEWGLYTRTGAPHRMSEAAAADLFGSGTVELASDDPVHDPNKDSSSYTYNLKVQSGGLATRFDVFSNWGQGFQGFRPRSFQPTDSPRLELSVDPSPSGRYARFDNIYADFRITYGSKLSTAPPATSRSGYGAGIDAFVTTLYGELLGRAPDRPDLLSWARRLASGMKPARVGYAIWTSPERQALLKTHAAPPAGLARSVAIAVRAGSQARRSTRPTPRGPGLSGARHL
jgi:hypothetical protein